MDPSNPLAPFGELIGREFPRTGEGIFLNTAAQGVLPRRAIEAMAAFESGRAYPHPVDQDRLDDIESTCRARIAELTGASIERVGLAVNTSEGLNLAAMQMPLEAGDKVLVVRGEFPANVYPWLALARQGVETRFLELEGPCLEADLVEEVLDEDPAIAVLALSLVQFSTGHRNPIEAIGAACRERGVRFVVDGIQGIGAIPFEWDEELYDLVACGGQKWLCAPWGSGFFLASERLCREAEPLRVGWLQTMGARSGEGFANLCRYDLSFHRDATRYEVGSYAYTALLGLSESIGLFLEVGVERIAAHARSLFAPVEEMLEERGGEIVSCRSPECRSGIFCFRLERPGATRGVYDRLVAAGIACAFREGAVRLSPHLYNTRTEIDRTVGIIAAAWPGATRPA